MSRTRLRLKIAKKRLKKPAGELLPIDLTTRDHPVWMTRAYSNNRYVVMINDNAEMTGGIIAIRAMVQRHNDMPIKNHWRELQNIKNALFGHQATAIEYYPPEKDLVDDANIYWIWVLPTNALPAPVLKKPACWTP